MIDYRSIFKRRACHCQEYLFAVVSQTLVKHIHTFERLVVYVYSICFVFLFFQMPVVSQRSKRDNLSKKVKLHFHSTFFNSGYKGLYININTKKETQTQSTYKKIHSEIHTNTTHIGTQTAYSNQSPTRPHPWNYGKAIKKCLKQSDSADLMGGGRLFQNLGARTAKEQSPLVFSLACGISNRFWLDDLSDCSVVYLFSRLEM